MAASTVPQRDPALSAEILSEALPFMKQHDRQTVVVKYGGHAMGDPELARCFARDIVLLEQAGLYPVVVHGGGPQIGAMLDRLKIKSEFAAGLRVTDKPTVEVVEMVLSGLINKEIVAAIAREGGHAVGISGKDAGLMIARKADKRHVPDKGSNLMKAVDLGFVGEPERIDPHIIDVMVKGDMIPVIAPLAVSPEGETLNINADTFAAALATALKAKRLLLLTDVDGVLDKNGKLLPELTVDEARALIADGSITGGMIPKVEGCIQVVESGVQAVVILNGKVPHAVLLELLTDHGAGTLLGTR